MRKFKALWHATTTGEKLLIVISFGFYVRTLLDVISLDYIWALVHMAANGVLTLLLVWSMRQPRGSGF